MSKECFEAGNACFQAKDFAGAVSWFTRLLDADPGNVLVRSNRAAAYVRLKEYGKAIEDARECIRLKPQWGKGYFRLAVCMHAMGELDKCYKAIAVAAGLEPSVQLYQDMRNSIREEISDHERIDDLENEVKHLFPAKSPLEGIDKERVNKLPVTVLSGFLGSGKTTLMKHILSNTDGLRVAVIVNDMSEINIDAALVKSSSSSSTEQVVELSNGCICCTLREDLLTEIARIATECADSIDYILIESTGISEPIPVAQTFLFEDLQGRSIDRVARLDTLVTVVDANSFLENVGATESLVDRKWQASENDERTISNLLIDQIEFANVIILNKIDLVPEDVGNKVEAIVGSLNPSAKVLKSTYSKVDLSCVLNTHLFDIKAASKAPGWLKELRGEHIPESEEYGIRSWVFTSGAPFDGAKLWEFYNDSEFLFETCNVIRSKGMCWIAEESRFVLDWATAGRVASCEGKGFWDEVISDSKHVPPRQRKTQLVFIGVDLDVSKLESRLSKMLSDCKDTPANLQDCVFWPMIRALSTVLYVHGLTNRATFTQAEASMIVTEAATCRDVDVAKLVRLEEVSALLTEFQTRSGDISSDEMVSISQLAEEYKRLMIETQHLDRESVQQLEADAEQVQLTME
mmetsp:Transcript_37382/g.60849  ORF Transcript_37382/g.60849 Transcript_37382/m.60849 type:complete len:633 (+) Transcript_37382:44-1942(+)